MPDSTINWTVVRWVEDAQERDRSGGSRALLHVGSDWQEAWENWYDEAHSYGEG